MEYSWIWDNKNQRLHINKSPDHPMRRCRIMVFMLDITKKLVYEYKAECKESLMWVN
jgi:hypothetical protein